MFKKGVFMDYYYKLSVVYPKDQKLEKNIDDILLSFHDEDHDTTGFGDVESPYFSELTDDLFKSISKQAISIKKDILILNSYNSDEGNSIEFIIFNTKGEVIKGTDISDLYGCSFEFSDQEEDEDEEFDLGDDDYYSDDKIDSIIEECSIEAYMFCKSHNLSITQEEIKRIVDKNIF
jgi:hypothetical protein